MKQRRMRERGFTLVELIVVITIIGILAAAVVVNYPRWVARARLNRAKTDVQSIKQEATNFRMEYGRYPESLEELVNPPPTPDGIPPEPFLEKMPVDPWNRPYLYSVQDGKPVIICSGPDGQEGTQDDISNIEQPTSLGGGLEGGL